MFVRVMTPKGETTTMECERVSTKENGDVLEVTIEPSNISHHVPIEEGYAVYLMNHEGRTIESYRWQPAHKERPPRFVRC